jgi:hypothetical protein
MLEYKLGDFALGLIILPIITEGYGRLWFGVVCFDNMLVKRGMLRWLS